MQKDTLLHRTTISFDLPIRLGMVRRSEDMSQLLGFQVPAQIPTHQRVTVIRQELAAVVIQDADPVEPAPSIHLRIRSVHLPQPVDTCGLGAEFTHLCRAGRLGGELLCGGAISTGQRTSPETLK